MKKSLVLSLLTVFLVSMLVVPTSAMEFTDLAASHWAYADVQTLVADQTVNGYDDGSFQPNGTVTRAQFVKMLGKGSVERATAYDDVSTEHWAYPFIMSASFPEDGTNKFQPDLAITRGLVAELLWLRGGSQSAEAAEAITAQYPKNPTAIAWVYTNGLMQGDDGVTLRLQDTLSRAEAAVLIVRARKGTSATTNGDVKRENIYNGLKLFDSKAYNPTATITNGEMSRAALRIGSEQFNLTYATANTAAAFEHPYGLDVTVIFKECLGWPSVSAELADKTATFGDTVAALTYQFISKSNSPMEYGATTEGLAADMTQMTNICLTFAKKHGVITLNEDLNKAITLQELVDVCVQLDGVVGSQSDILTDVNGLTGRLKKVDHSLLLTDTAYGDFRVRLKDMPSAVYTTSFVSRATKPSASYDFAREYSTALTSMLVAVKDTVQANTGATIRLTYYPSLVCDNGNGFTMRVACDIVEMSGEKTLSDLFTTAAGMTGADTSLKQGDRIYFDIATGAPVTSLVTDDENAVIEQFICRG